MATSGSAEAKRGKTCDGGCNANEENFAFAAMRGKTYGSCNTSAGSHAATAMHGKTCGSCNLRLQYKCGKLCHCCHKWENLRQLQYKRRKSCSYCHARENLWQLQFKVAIQVREIMQPLSWEGKTCGGCNIKAWELCNHFPARENICWPQDKRGKLYNCCHKREKSENLLRL